MDQLSDKPYYSQYEQRYSSLYAQGVDSWAAAHGEQLASTLAAVTQFLETWRSVLGRVPRIVEFGCGEGYVGELIAKSGCYYTGYDLAPSAVMKARERLAPFPGRAQVHELDCVAPMKEPTEAFDAGIDIACLHMLVVDADRGSYLRNVVRMLHSGAPMLWCQGYRRRAPSGQVPDVATWVHLTRVDLDAPVEVSETSPDAEHYLQLPRLVARPRTLMQYRAEFRAVGLKLVSHLISEDGLSVEMTTVNGRTGRPAQEHTRRTA